MKKRKMSKKEKGFLKSAKKTEKLMRNKHIAPEKERLVQKVKLAYQYRYIRRPFYKKRKDMGKMNIIEIIKILNLHSVPHYEKDGRIYVDSMIGGTDLFEIVEDVTEWSYKKLRLWLGY